MKYPTHRALFTGVLFVVIIGLWHQQSTMLAISSDLNAVYPPTPAILLLLVVIGLLNPLIGRIKSSLRYDASEVITVYLMTLIGTPLVATGWAQTLLPMQVSPYYYATPENNYQRDFFGHLKSWFGPSEPETVRGFFEGGAQGIPWLQWLPMLLIWGLLSLVIYATFYCVVILVKKQWIERERLSFPLLKLPLEMIQGVTDGKHSLLRNKLTWLGACVPFILHTVNGLNAYLPGIPAIPTSLDLSRFLTQHPWNAMWGVELHFKPMVIGVGYLMNLEVAFSCWFFFLMQKLMLVVTAAMAWSGADSAMAGFPWLQEQQHGSFLALFIVYLWVLRKHLKDSFKVAVSGVGEEAAKYRLAWGGLIGGSLFIIGFAKFAGMSLLVAVIFFLLLLVHTFVYSRINAEAGLAHGHMDEAVTDIVSVPFGSTAVGTKDLTVLASFGWVMKDMRACMMPRFLDGYKLDTENKTRLKGILIVIGLAVIVGMIVGAWTELVLCYKYGANSLCNWRRGQAHAPFQSLSALIQNPLLVKSPMPSLAIGFSMAVIFLFSYLRMRFIWWPFHPIGYAVSMAMGIWSMFFFGWLFRLVIFKMGGTNGYRKALPFFLGMILGDFIMFGFWGLMGACIKGHGYLPRTW